MNNLLSVAGAIVQNKAKGVRPSEEHVNQGLVCILSIKEENRKLVVQAEAEKAACAKEQSNLQSADLDVLRAELAHHQKEEEEMTRSLKVVQEGALGLQPEAEFLASHPHAHALNAHELMKARLLHEHGQRKGLVQMLHEHRAEEQQLAKQYQAQHEQLVGLQGKLHLLEQQSRPLQAVLSPVAPLHGCMDKSAYLLPAPLYVVYAQLVSACEALHEPCRASIEGDLTQGEAALRDSTSGSLEKGTSAKDSLRHHRQRQQQSISSLSEAEVYQPHPLSVGLDILPSSGSSGGPGGHELESPQPLLRIVFHYLPALRVVTALCQPHSKTDLLAALFPGDDGSGACIEALAQLQGGGFRFSPAHPSRPYMWCQHLAGLDFVSPLPRGDACSGKERSHQQLVSTVVQRIRSLLEKP
ncbi:THO complex, subunit 5 [Dunaliella salina]|uniref:THO complex, subunit 5 n=1 Tax=Dunaliella salina TaxID=3046 RepID=A0ABQ7GZD1_DUNSA|nr:THO complex, subunit 5 [Dunaliella salina]|eukprot:KAF5839964.1 THO complex, subunit 5 [Dunaliella salina]